MAKKKKVVFVTCSNPDPKTNDPKLWLLKAVVQGLEKEYGKMTNK